VLPGLQHWSLVWQPEPFASQVWQVEVEAGQLRPLQQSALDVQGLPYAKQQGPVEKGQAVQVLVVPH
jgi:hypothetical protein